jgi:hypothetical protein
MPRLSSVVAALLLATSAQASQPEVPEQAVVGRWQGTYLCTQGWTGLDLTMELAEDPEPGQELQAISSTWPRATGWSARSAT